ncbi:MAG: hypothetical protein HF977_09690 [ANME-2 cluster archaeon]|nr:hypothetical protein [ANME-2 cluster archaeon]
MLTVRAAGGGRCMMQAAARVFGMEPGGAVTGPACDSDTPKVLTLWLEGGGVWCACSLSGRRVMTSMVSMKGILKCGA